MFFWSLIRIWLSSLSVSLIIQMENFGWVETIFDNGRRLRSPRGVQSRFRGTRTMQYPLCEMRDCSLFSLHQHWERTPSGIVSWTAARILRRNKRMKEFEGGRRPSKGRGGNKGEMIRQNIQESEWTMRTERAVNSVGKERMILLFNSIILQGDCHFVEKFVNLEGQSNHKLPNVEQRYLELE